MSEFRMERVGITVTTCCNLRCRLCSVGIPYLPEHRHYPLAELENMLARCFEIATHVNKLSVTGGEPLLYPELPELLRFLKTYADRFDTVDIVTNGTLVPGAELMAAAQALGPKMFFLVDDYGAQLSTEIEAIRTVLQRSGIPHLIRANHREDAYCGGWVDYGISPRKRLLTEAAVEARYAGCAYPNRLHFCFNIIEGKMFPCAPARRCYQLGITRNDAEHIDLFDPALSIADQRAKVRSIYGGKRLEACAYCNGLCEDSERFVPAEQLSPS